ncbi:MAG: hypothetical protein CMK71_01240 [Pseudomonadaceae bacterium]|nr:hypothetical protein [Pseudomonadaceae bacterium]
MGFRAYVGFWFHCSPNPQFKNLTHPGRGLTMLASQCQAVSGVRQTLISAARLAHRLGTSPTTVVRNISRRIP